MRIAAGVILIVAAVINLFACLGYLGIGGVGSGLETAIEQTVDEDVEWTDEERAAFDEGMDQIGASSTIMLAVGIFLLVSVGVLITGAVFLFMNKNAKFIMAAGAMAIIAELLGVWVFGFGVMNLIGLAAGALALLAAMGMGKSAAPAEAG